MMASTYTVGAKYKMFGRVIELSTLTLQLPIIPHELICPWDPFFPFSCQQDDKPSLPPHRM